MDKDEIKPIFEKHDILACKKCQAFLYVANQDVFSCDTADFTQFDYPFGFPPPQRGTLIQCPNCQALPDRYTPTWLFFKVLKPFVPFEIDKDKLIWDLRDTESQALKVEKRLNKTEQSLMKVLSSLRDLEEVMSAQRWKEEE